MTDQILPKEICSIPHCGNEIAFLFIRAKDRQVVQTATYCKSDGQDFLSRYYEKPLVGNGRSQSDVRGVVYDVEVLSFNYDQHYASQLFLRENGGSRHLSIAMGAVELSAIRWELEQHPALRPRTHHTMDSLIVALDACLSCVIIDNYNESTNIYEAKLCVQHMETEIHIDSRPSDAITLALICDVPIFVAKSIVPRA